MIISMPAAPATLADTGLNAELVLHLVAKSLFFGGELTGSGLAAKLGVCFPVIEPSIDHLKRDRLAEIAGGEGVTPASYRYRLTDAGRARASLFVEQNQYSGHLPVPVEQYRAYMKAVAPDDIVITPELVRRAFRHLVLSDSVLDHVGPAVTAHHSLFVYGQPGNGKTVLAKAIHNLLLGEIAVPHALTVDGQIIQVFDPLTHEEIAGDLTSVTLARTAEEDQRWVRCGRPMVIAGGELTLAALDLGRAGPGFYRAPLQTLANGGLLVIDDFGRQQAKPVDLLNRWIVPLESRVDYLTLDTGVRVEMPFDVLVVFATNLRPADLVDEAFLRRIQYKVRAENPTPAQFAQIFERCCRERQVEFDPRLVDTLIATQLRPRGVTLRGCQPRDLIDHALRLARYLGRPHALAPDLLASACDGYFVDGPEHAPAGSS